MKILITGSASGIGFDTGVELIKKGHFIYFTVHREKQIKTVINKLNMKVKSQSIIDFVISRYNEIK